jgi:hypothetical protein
LGAEVRNFEDALAYFEARFSRITLEDRNLAAIARHRILKPKSETARLQIQQAFEKVRREPESVRDVLLTSESNLEDFEQLYPFSPALVKTLVVVSSALQRERTALKIMMQLLVENQDSMRLGELVPVGSLFAAMLDGHDAFSQELRHQFDKARKLWEQKLRPALLRSAGLTEEQLLAASPDDPAVRRFRTDERIVGTLVLSALAPEAETLRSLTAQEAGCTQLRDHQSSVARWGADRHRAALPCMGSRDGRYQVHRDQCRSGHQLTALGRRHQRNSGQRSA